MQNTFTETKQTLNNIVYDDVLNYVLKDYIVYNEYDIKRQSLILSVLNSVNPSSACDIIGYTKEAYELLLSLIKRFINKLLVSNLDLIKKGIRDIDETFIEEDEKEDINCNILKHLLNKKCFEHSTIPSRNNQLKKHALTELTKGVSQFYSYSHIRESDTLHFEDLLPNDLTFTPRSKYGLRCVIEYLLAEILELTSNFCKNEFTSIFESFNDTESEEESEEKSDDEEVRKMIQANLEDKKKKNKTMDESFETIINWIYSKPEVFKIVKENEEILSEVEKYNKHFEKCALERIERERIRKIRDEEERILEEQRKQKQNEYRIKFKDILSELIQTCSDDDIIEGEYYPVITSFHIEYIIKNDEELNDLFYL